MNETVKNNAETPEAAPITETGDTPETTTTAPETTTTTPSGNSERVFDHNGEKITVPENFWDKDANAVNVAALLKSQADLRKQIGEDLSPKDGAYDIAIPEEYKGAIEIDKESVIYKSVCAFAKEHKLSPDEFNDLVRPYIDDLAAPFVNAQEDLNTEDQKLVKIFGNKKQEVIERVNTFIQNTGLGKDPEVLNEIGLLTMTASGIKALNMIATAMSPNMPMVSSSPTTNYTEDQLKEMMRDPRYYRDHEPSFVSKVTNGFKSLYPDK